MADDLDQGYIQTRQTMREYQSRMLMEPVQQGSDVYMGAKEGGKPQDGAKAGTPGQAETPQPSSKGTTLPPDQEAEFQKWYVGIAQQTGNNPNPDDPQQKYDYRGFYKSGQSPAPDPTDVDPETGQARLHFTSQFKHDDHPNRFVNTEDGILDSKNDKIVTPEQFNKIATPEQKETVQRKAPRKEITVDRPEVAAVKQQFAADMQKMASGESGVEALGRGGKALAEAARPGFVTAARALGMDEQAAETVGDAFVEFMGGLPGGQQSDYAAGIETALAALPVLHVAMKAGGKATEFLAANKDAIIQEFQKAATILKSERGSIPLGPGGKQIDLGGAGQAISDNMYEALWQKVQKGDTTEAGQPSVYLQVGKMLKDAGKLNSVEDFKAVAQQIRAIKDSGVKGPEFQKAIGELVQNFQRGSVPLGPGGKGPETSQPRQFIELTQTEPGMVPGSQPHIARKFQADVTTMARLRQVPDNQLGKMYADAIAGYQDGIDAGIIEQGTATGDKIELFKKHIGAELDRRGLAPHPSPPWAFKDIRKPLPFDPASEAAIAQASGGGTGKPPSITAPGAAAPGDEPISPKALALIAKREESKQAHEFSLEGFKEELTKQRRGPVLSDEAVRKLAGESGFTLQDLLDLKPGSVLAPEIQVKAREVYKATVDNMKQSAKAYLATGSPQDFDAFAQAFTMAGLSTTRIIGTYSEAGRTFRLLNQKYPSLKKPGAAQATDPEFSIQDQYIQEMYKFFRGVEEKSKMGGFDKARTGQGMGPDGMISPGQLAQMVVDLPSEEAMMAFAKAALKPTWGDMMYEIWVNGLLSGPITHSTNIISNAATLLWNIPERQLAGLLKPSAVRPGEAAAMIGGVVESVGDAWKLAWKAFKEDAPQFGASKLENMPRKAITADALELTGATGAAVDFLGNAIRLPGRFLMAGDDFFKSIAFRAELRALAKRQAFREVNELGLTGKEAARKAKEIEHKILTDPPETIKQDAQEFAAYTTFTRELGKIGTWVQGINNVPFGRVVLPFIRTPANIFKFAGERTPLALASKAVRDELAAGGERQALALAKIGLGSMTMAYMATLAANGHITGGGPKDKVLRKQLELEGWQPYSFKIGNEYVSYARIEPLGSLIGMAADAADLMGQLGTKDSAELASALTVAISRNVANKTFVKGLAGTLNAVTSQDVHVVKSFLEKELPTLMPYSSAMGQTAKNVDPVMRDVQSILDAFKAKVPGFSDDLPPQRNLYGDKVLLQGGMGPDLFSPLYVREIKNDPVAHELNRLAYPFTMPSRHIDGIQLTPKIYDRYAELSGKGSEMTGKQSLHDALHETMRQGIYKQAADGPDGGKVVLLKATINRFREMAALQLEQENKDFAQARQQQRMRAATKFDQNARQKAGPAPTLQ